MVPWLCNRFYVAATLIALVAMSAVAVSAEMPLVAMFAIWGLLAVNAGVANWIDYSAVISDSDRPLFWGLALNGARFLVLVVGACVLSALAADVGAVMVMALVGYFAFLSAQVGYLHVHSLKVSEAV
ncbi:MAG: hypothetical protein ACI8W8_003605 [Rhodothermales bacterium]|jgi:hypothetical protein